jgi:hypothetical protein
MIVLVLLVILGAPTTQDGSTYARSPTGYRHWYDYMAQQGVAVKRWQRNYEQLKDTGQTLIQIWGSRSDSPNLRDQQLIQTWVKKGNTLITLSWNGRVTAAPFSSQLSSSVGAVLIDTTRRYRLKPQQHQRAELEDRSGSVVWSQSAGQGRWIISTYPWLAANVYEGANYKFLASLARRQGGTIWVDEWLHGHQEQVADGWETTSHYQGVFDYLRQTPVVAIAAQMALVILLLAWGQNNRFGPTLSIQAPEASNSEQYIQALAGVLHKTGQTDFVLKLLGQQLRQQLSAILGLGAEAGQGQFLPDDAILAEQWALRTGRSPQELLELFNQAGQTYRLKDPELLAWVGKAESILRGMP